VSTVMQTSPACQTKRLRFLLDRVSSSERQLLAARSSTVTFLPMEAIGERGELDQSATRELEDVRTGYSVFKDGDVVVAKITPCFENGKGAVIHSTLSGIGFGTTELHVLTPGPGLDSRFLYYVTASPEFRWRGAALMTGAAGQQRVPEDFIRDFPVLALPLARQQAIVRFLDQELSRLDGVVAAKSWQVELLAEKRKAIIASAVTRGIDPRAKLRDSGLPWLGEIPRHWEVRRVKTVSEFITSGPRGWSERVGDDGSLFIQSGDLNDLLQVEFGTAKRARVDDDAEAARTKLENGDVVVCITGAKTGNVAVCVEVPEPAYVNQHLCLVRPSSAVLPSYLGSSLKSSVGQMQFALFQYGLKQGLSLENVREVLIVLPPLDEQYAIVVHIARETTKLDNVRAATERTIALLKERRAALIAAAVTGQIDVGVAA